MSTTFSPLQVYGENFQHSRACNSEANSSIWPEIDTIQDVIPVLVIGKFEEDPKLKALSCPQHLLPVFKSRNSNLSEMLLLFWLPASLITIRSKMRSQLCLQHSLHYKYMGKIVGVQGQVTPKRTVLARPKSNSSEVLCPSSLSASLMKFQSKLNAISCP